MAVYITTHVTALLAWSLMLTPSFWWSSLHGFLLILPFPLQLTLIKLVPIYILNTFTSNQPYLLACLNQLIITYKLVLKFNYPMGLFRRQTSARVGPTTEHIGRLQRPWSATGIAGRSEPMTRNFREKTWRSGILVDIEKEKRCAQCAAARFYTRKGGCHVNRMRFPRF